MRRRAGVLAAIAVLVAGAVVIVPRVTRRSSNVATGCHRQLKAGWSVARAWNEVLLAAVRRDFPAPTVHARNLFHLSVVMWDSWAAFHAGAKGYLVSERAKAARRDAAAEEAMSYAAYTLLRHRYEHAVGAADSLRAFEQTMTDLCYPTSAPAGDDIAALGLRIANAAIDLGAGDGSLESNLYVDTSVTPANEPLVVGQPGATMNDPNAWQPLRMETLITQNGLQQPSNTQTYVGPQWGSVTSFALPPAADGLTVDLGPPPRLGDATTDAAFKAAAVDVVRASAALGPNHTQDIDISPAALGNNPLGTNDGKGYATNPVTRRPYAANVVSDADFRRVLAEFWADGPKSETPPGHWNVLANDVSDHLGASHWRIGGKGRSVDRLEWDVKLYFALNGATHDAAVAAWGLKRHYNSVRPISMIRYMGGKGQSSDPSLPHYDRDGLPLVPGLVELITPETTVAGQRHAELAGHEGEIAIYAWRGQPADIASQVGGVDWIRAVDWMPYQRKTFVTPSFPGYVSGHSTFSRAAAEVLTAMTGSPYFPDGLGSVTLPKGYLHFESGPSTDVTLQWATYFDAADQAGQSRIFGGIHISADDFAGRRLGATCGQGAWAKAQTYFG